MWNPFSRTIEKEEPKGIRPRAKRNYHAAKSSDFLSDWSTDLLRPDALLRQGHSAIVARARDAQRNNPYVAGAINLYTNFVVGPDGINLRATSKNKNNTLDVLANEAIDKAFKNWSMPMHCDIARKQSLLDMQKLMIAELIVSGEVFIKIYRSQQAEPYGFSLQIIDSTLCDVELNDVLTNGNTIQAGIETNPFGIPVAYYFKKTYSRDRSQPRYIKDGYTRVEASNIIHIFDQEFAGQTRGCSKLSKCLVNLHHLEKYAESALLAARVGAAKSLFITREEPDGIGPGESEDAEDEDSGLVIDASLPFSISEMPYGSKIDTIATNYPDANYAAFMQSNLRSVATALGLNYNTLANDLESVNFSSMKAGSFVERRSFLAMRRLIVDHALIPIYHAWLRTQLINQTIKIGNSDTALNPGLFSKYTDVKFVSQKFEDVDAVKSSQARRLQLEDGTISRTQIISDMGYEPTEVFKEIAEENKILEELGIREKKDETK